MLRKILDTLTLLENADYTNFKLVSSNQNKLKEFKRFGLAIEIDTGTDLPEINGPALDVIIYKTKDAGPFKIVEDTSLEIEGLNVGVNIRWVIDQLLENDKLSGKKAIWTVLIGVNDGKSIEIYSGIINGHIVAPKGKGFGFDPIFVPNGSNLTLSELEEIGKKDNFSARKKAIDNMLTKKFIKTIPIKTIPKWEGEYQH